MMIRLSVAGARFTAALVLFIFSAIGAAAQTTTQYSISFENATHHEAHISISYTNLEEKPLEVRMSRSSPGRYALHEFAKNVYDVRAFDGSGNPLEITRPNPHQWDVSGHDGTVRFEYTLFANRGDGTYSQVDESHALLNIPSTFAWARSYEHRPIEITFDVRDDLNWKVATQLKHLDGNRFAAPNLYYFLDSPVLVADFDLRERMVSGQNIRLALKTHATDAEIDAYFEKVVAVVKAQEAVFDELPRFDFGEYTFLCVFMPNASGDGMEHRNSTVVTNTKPIDRPLGETSMGTMSHEFIHIWNVERIRPASLEPFNFEEANMSGELWFAEGFTSYYTNLILVRAGIMTPEAYVRSLSGGLNAVINSPGRRFFNPIEMSYQAPFVDAARSVDPINRENTFISYYTYGSVLGLALDLELRSLDRGLDLDGYMRLLWDQYGKTEIPYSIRDLKSALAEYAGADLAGRYFDQHIYKSEAPDFKRLLNSVGVSFGVASSGRATLGTGIQISDGVGRLRSNALKGSAIYEAGINTNDEIVRIDGKSLDGSTSADALISNRKPGDRIEVVFRRWGQERVVQLTLGADQSVQTLVDNQANAAATARRTAWLQ